MARYINASDVPRLLGKKYKFFWTKEADINRIIFGKSATPFLEEKIEKLPEKVIDKILPENKILPKKRKYEAAIKHVCDFKKEITTQQTHQEYIKNEKDFIKTLPLSLQDIVKQDFTMERGNVEEKRILTEMGIPKTNEIKYLQFNIDKNYYKIGCRFDGPRIEIKTRKNNFLGVTEYERVQVHLYMAINNDPTWTVKEKFNDQVVDHEIFFDANYFEEVKKDINNSWEYYLKKNK